MKEKISLSGVYKIFGDQPRGRALDLAKAGVPKDEVQARTGHVVGLTDVVLAGQARGQQRQVCRICECGGRRAEAMQDDLEDPGVSVFVPVKPLVGEFTCSICFFAVTDAVMLRGCGHNFWCGSSPLCGRPGRRPHARPPQLPLHRRVAH